MWLGHDDLIAKEYIERCVDIMRQKPDIVLTYANTRYIDDQDELICNAELVNDCESQSPSERFTRIVAYHHKCEAICGVMRTDVLKQTRLHGAFADSDRVLLAEMALRGRFHLIGDHLFLRRQHASQASKRRDRWETTLVFDPSKSGKLIFPFVREAVELFRSVGRATLPWSDRIRCYKHLLRWFYHHRHNLSKDIDRAVDFSLKRLFSERQVDHLISARQRSF